jgi:hypothetical protein
VVRGVFVTLLAVSAFGAAVPAAGVPLSRIAAGVTVGSVEVGGLTSETARGKIAQRFGAPLSFYEGDRTWEVRPTELGANAGILLRRSPRQRPGGASIGLSSSARS